MPLSTNCKTRKDVVEKAKSLLGLRFRFYGRARERGVDCVGVVLLTGWELGLLPADCKIPDYPFPVSTEVFDAFADYMDEREEYAEGRVAIWADKSGAPKHVGILTFNERWRCIGISWDSSRHVAYYTPTGLEAWKLYDFRGVE